MAKDLKDTLEMIFPRGAAHAQAERTLQILPYPRAMRLCVREASLLSFGLSAWGGMKASRASAAGGSILGMPIVG